MGQSDSKSDLIWNPPSNPTHKSDHIRADSESDSLFLSRILYLVGFVLIRSDFLVTWFKTMFELLVGDTPSDFSD